MESVKKIILLAIFCLFPPSLWAYNFLYLNPTTGDPIGWEPGTTIHYYVDPGSLGRLTNEQARTLIRAAMDVWENASPYANMPHFEYAGLLPEDVNSTNYAQYVNREICYTDDLTSCPAQAQRDLKTVIIFDEDNSILRSGLCSAIDCVGYGQPSVFSGNADSPGYIRQGQIVLGSFAGSNSTRITTTVGMMVHELGHLLGLAHTAVNQEIILNDTSGYGRYIPAMYYRSAASSTANIPLTSSILKPDDISGVTSIYHSSTTVENTGSIEGQILKSNSTSMRHVNVVARNNSDPLCEAYSSLTSQSYCYSSFYNPLEEPDCVEDNSIFFLKGLSPASYTIEVEEISDSNLGASLVPSLSNDYIAGDAEFWNTGDVGDEANTTRSLIALAAGETIENIDIILNRSAVTDSRVKYIPLSTFTAGAGTRCPETPPIDYASLIGISEAGSGGDTSGTGGSGGTGSSSPGGCSLLNN